MLSSFSSFLPSALQLGNNSNNEHRIQQQEHLPSPQEQDFATGKSDAYSSTADETGVKKKKKERTNETFIVVRPPPAKSNHPLNLQVQLVPPNAKGPDRSLTGRQSIDFSAPTNLERVTSNRSDASAYTGYSSTASFSSVASSTASGRRMIIPLYNLQAHNVMTNMVVDAGTDAKIAKFLKRGIELIGLAILEPIEVWPGAELSVKRGSTPTTPTSSAISLSSAGMDVHHISVAPPEIASTPTNGGAKKIFGKLFKKKNDTLVASSPTTSSFPSHKRNTSLTLVPPSSAKRLSALPPFPSSTLPLPGTPPPDQATNPNASLLRPPVLGIQPTLASPVHPPVGRPAQYVWIIRRWLKGMDNGLLGVVGRLREPGGGGGAQPNALDVRFEWTRGRSKTAATRTRKRSGDPSVSRRASVVTSETHSPSPRRRTKRLSTASVSSEGREEEDDGAESDPEDSETPWTCTLRISSGLRADLVKARVATLSPTPHHPKVVAMLKVPFPLPGAPVMATPGFPSDNKQDPAAGLTPEEIKDVVSTTALWLVVREGFGGVGKVSRKGDGWRIRA